MASQLVWELVKNNNAFKVESFGKTFTSDPHSQTGQQTYSGLGFIFNNSLAVQSGKDNKNFTVYLKKRQRFPQKTFSAEKAGKNVNKEAKGGFFYETLPIKHGVQRVAKIIRKKWGPVPNGIRKQALRKLYYLHKAASRKAVAAAKAAAAEKKK